jgi:hypothetical protein
VASDPTCCRRCDRSFASKASLRKHAERKHDDAYLKQIKQRHRTCPYCGTTYDNPHALGGHVVTCSENPDVEATRPRIAEANRGNAHSDAVKERIRRSMQEAVDANPDSYAAGNVCGRTERITVNTLDGTETTVHGTWERGVARFLNWNEIQWTNDVTGFPYRWEGTEHPYFPDFHLPPHECYIEVKGYERDRDHAKWVAFPEPLIVIRRAEIEAIRSGTYHLGP